MMQLPPVRLDLLSSASMTSLEYCVGRGFETVKKDVIESVRSHNLSAIIQSAPFV